MSSNNPFANFDFSKFDPTKMLGDLKLPGVDMEAMMAAQRKNIEAVVSANKVAIEGMQAVAKRQAEILAEYMGTFTSTAQQLAGSGSPQEMTGKQAELVKDAMEKALTNMRELAEMVGKSNTEAFEVINNRVHESLNELKGMMEPKK